MGKQSEFGRLMVYPQSFSGFFGRLLSTGMKMSNARSKHLFLVVAAMLWLPMSPIAGSTGLFGQTVTAAKVVSTALPSDAEAPATGLNYQVEQIDKMIEQVWTDYELRPSKPATEGEWCRRAYLDLIGRIPSVKELNEFLADRSAEKKSNLVNKLLYDDAYTEEFARNWTTIWTNLLIGRTGGTEDNSMISRDGMQKYLRDSFARAKPYDKMVYELVTATGSTTPTSKDFNGATNFLIDKVNEEDAALATAATTKIFMGLQVQCTQCHNHPFNDWKQQKYWEMNAFFRQAKAFRSEMMAADNMTGASAQLLDQDFAGESRKDPSNAELFYELRNGLLSVAYPVFVDGTEIDKSGYVLVSNRREKLAELMINSPYFTRSIANRTWGHFLGYGFTSPVDDLGPHNIPSHPELLEYLSEEFRKSNFDLRQLMTWIVLSRAYGLSSQRNSYNQKDDPLLGESPKFSHFYIRQMEAEQLYESLLVATEVAKTGSYQEQESQKARWMAQFVSAFGNDEGEESTSFNGTIPQILMMFNGDLVRNATSTGKGTLINRLAYSNLNDAKKIDHLFLAGLSRTPNSKEKNIAGVLFKTHAKDQKEALRDMWWVILNTNEFIFNH